MKSLRTRLRLATGLLVVGALLGMGALVLGPAVWWSVGKTAAVFQAVPDEALEACDADPRRWHYRSDRGVEAWALGEGGVLHPDGPKLPPTLALRLAAGESEPVMAGRAEAGMLVMRREGACSTVLVRWPMDGSIRRNVALLFALVLGVAVLGTGLLGWALVLRPLLAHVEALDHASRSIGRASYRSVTVDEELQAVADALDEAHERVVDERERLERHLADVAHDLRSPLTALQLRLERLANGDREALAGALADVAYLDVLTDNLALTAQGGALRPVEGTADATAVAQRVVDRFAVLGRRLGIEVLAAVPDDPVLVPGPSVYLEQILGNLVHNAVRHHDGEGTVVVVVEPDEPVRIEVCDDGPGSPDALPPTRAEPGQTHGLGLSIVRQLTVHLGGELAVTAAEPRGLVIQLSLPSR